VILQPRGTEENLPVGYAAAINEACRALNLPLGKPTRYPRRVGERVQPAEGEPIHVYVEWTGEDGKTVRVAAEDLVYDANRGGTIDAGTWIYVGSTKVRHRETGVREYMADLNGHIVSTFGSAHAIISNKTRDASDDDAVNFFRGYTDRVPVEGTPVKLIISRGPLDGVFTFPKDAPLDTPTDDDEER